jgi:phage/plasmid primase-like uncharacterized protein
MNVKANQPEKFRKPYGNLDESRNRDDYRIESWALWDKAKEAYLNKFGLEIRDDIKTFGPVNYVGTTEDKKGKKPIRVFVHGDTPQNVHFNDLKRGHQWTWFPIGQEPLTPIEREQRHRKYLENQAQREQEIQARQMKRAQWARELWRRAMQAKPDFPYLARKCVGVYGIRYLPNWERRIYQEGANFTTIHIDGGVLVVPMRDQNGFLWNLQFIFPEVCQSMERDRDFLPGARVNGLFHWIGHRTSTLCIGEGYSTCASIFEATRYRCIVAFSAGNLPAVALNVRRAFPDAKIVICGDNDLPDKRGRRAGIEKAEEAARLVDGFIALPPVPGQDFNDWAGTLRSNHYGR